MLCSLENALSESQRVNTRAQSALDLNKQNLRSEEIKYEELVKSMQEVRPLYIIFFKH